MYHFFLCVCVCVFKCVLVCVCGHKCRTKVLLWHWLGVESPFSYFPQTPRGENDGIPRLSKVAAWHGKGRHVEFNWYVTHTHTTHA